MEALTEQEWRLVRAVRKGKDPSALLLLAVKLCEDIVNGRDPAEDRSTANTIVSESDTERKAL